MLQQPPHYSPRPQVTCPSTGRSLRLPSDTRQTEIQGGVAKPFFGFPSNSGRSLPLPSDTRQTEIRGGVAKPFFGFPSNSGRSLPLPSDTRQREIRAELRNRSLASLIDEMRTIADTWAMRIDDGFKYNRKFVTSNRPRSVPHKSCVLCKAAGRMFNSHDLIDCRYLSQSDKKTLGWSRLVTSDVCEDDEVDLYEYDTPENVFSDPAVRLVERDPVSHRVGVVQSPVLYTFYRQHPIAITLGTGATSLRLT